MKVHNICNDAQEIIVMLILPFCLRIFAKQLLKWRDASSRIVFW